MNITDIHRGVASYYAQKLHEHGATARGVDWSSEASQALRFDQLLQIAARADEFSLNEIGCGYGALVHYLITQGRSFAYLGIDVSEEMIAAARIRYPQNDRVGFAVSATPDRPRDFCVASGVFNVKLNVPDEQWLSYVLAILDIMHEYSGHGFAFNALTRYSDPEKMRDYLYYADPLQVFDHCKRRYSRNVALLHDYGLYEFTIMVRKNVG
jgi:SAM-dependent methyltransferase